MTSTIIDGYENNLIKFEAITKIFNDLKTLSVKHEETMMRVIRYYNIIFKNMSARRKEVHLKGTNDIYVMTKAGIGQRQAHQYNSINLTTLPRAFFLNKLQFISQPENKLQFKKVLSKEKSKIFDNFLKKTNLLEIKNVFEMKANEEIKAYKIKLPVILDKIILNYTTLELFLSPVGKIQVPLYNLSLENSAILEQIYPKAKRLLLTALKNKQKEIDNLNKFIEYLKTKFENQLVLEELYYKPRPSV